MLIVGSCLLLADQGVMVVKVLRVKRAVVMRVGRVFVLLCGRLGVEYGSIAHMATSASSIVLVSCLREATSSLSVAVGVALIVGGPIVAVDDVQVVADASRYAIPAILDRRDRHDGIDWWLAR